MHTRMHHDLERWTDAGLIDRDQAASIVAFESAHTPSGSGFLAEGLGYVGAALAVGAGILITRNVWDDLAVAGRLSLVAVLAIAMFGGGWALRTRTVPTLQRLTDVLWFGAVVASGAFAGLFTSEVAGAADEWGGVAIGVTAAVVGGVLWAVRRRSLELIAFAGGILIAVISAMSLLSPEPSSNVMGSVIWVLGAALFAAGSLGWIAPHATARVLGAIGVGFGSQLLSAEGAVPGTIIAVVSAGALIVYAVRRHDDVMLAIGGLMTLLFVPQLIFAVFGESLGAPVALFIAGLALVAIAASIAKARSGDKGA